MKDTCCIAFGKAAVRNFRHNKSLSLVIEFVKQRHDFAERNAICHRDGTISAVAFKYRIRSRKSQRCSFPSSKSSISLTRSSMYKSSSSVFHYQLLWVSRLRCCCKRLQRHCCNSACTIFRKDSESGKQTPLRRFLRHSQKQLFSAQLRLSVNGICISADKRRLYGA